MIRPASGTRGRALARTLRRSVVAAAVAMLAAACVMPYPVQRQPIPRSSAGSRPADVARAPSVSGRAEVPPLPGPSPAGSPAGTAPPPKSSFDEAEAAYQAGRDGPALAAFNRLAELDPTDARAWLRLGNVQHRRGDAIEAARAYRRAAQSVRDDPASRIARQKALMNLVLLGIETSRQALAELDRDGLDPTLVATRAELAGQLDALGARRPGTGLPRASVRPVNGQPSMGADSAIDLDGARAGLPGENGPTVSPVGQERPPSVERTTVPRAAAARVPAEPGDGRVRIEYLQGNARR